MEKKDLLKILKNWTETVDSKQNFYILDYKMTPDEILVSVEKETIPGSEILKAFQLLSRLGFTFSPAIRISIPKAVA